MIRLENKINRIEEICTIINLQDVNTDLITMVCGEKLGSGAFRTVFEFNLNPKMVVKIEHSNTDCNVSEYLLWDEIQGLKGKLAWVKDWFAPIHWCSPNGKILIMERTEKNHKNKKRPHKVPSFFSDVKTNNFGWIGNKFVCHDYGFIHSFIKYEKNFEKIEW